MTSNGSTPAVVVDASVAVKWLLTDEDDTAAAVDLLRQQREGSLRLLAPRQIEVGVVNALRESLRWGVSLFDAFYVSLAVIADPRLITGDRRLLRAGSDLAPYLLDVRSFTP